MRAEPYFLKTKTAMGWILRVAGVPGLRYIGGDPKPTPREACDAYFPVLRKMHPTRTGALWPASPTQMKRAIKAGFYS